MKSEEKLQFYFLAVGKHWRDWFWLVEIRMLSANAAERNRPKLGSCFVSDVCKSVGARVDVYLQQADLWKEREKDSSPRYEE
ncbi:unnamed protein product [Enterobius vermicularis]|uniref:PWWP domain-containing protein n=1 Tax=Enterobius vermicularis TaxID=51028 RepID=A0A0N4V063_ENTVE|nr:unnamed protein product [Enterobius vermicularis]